MASIGPIWGAVTFAWRRLKGTSSCTGRQKPGVEIVRVLHGARDWEALV
jgi:hypothetical protein